MSVSFIHKGSENMASYRYRARIPAHAIGATLNDLSADIVIFSKPQPEEYAEMKALSPHQRVIVDFCDNHFDQPGFEHYRLMASEADLVTCSSKYMQSMLLAMGYNAQYVDDPFEFEEAEPHANGDKLLWFGHQSNLYSLHNSLQEIDGYPLHVVTKAEGAIEWSKETLLREMAWADIYVQPATSPYKSSNRIVEAVRRGLYVVAHPHPSHERFRTIGGIAVGSLWQGIEWVKKYPWLAKQQTKDLQGYIREMFSPKAIQSQWDYVLSVAAFMPKKIGVI